MAVESVDLELGEAAIITVVPPAPWPTPTVEVRDRKGVLLGSPTAVPSTVDTEVDGATDASTFVVLSAVGITRGLTVQVEDAQWGTASSVVSVVNDTTIKLVTPLPGVPAVGATVKGLDIEIPISDELTGELGLSFIVRVKSGGIARQRVFNVVTYPFVGPCDALQIREHMTRHFPGERAVHSEEWAERTAAEVNRLLRGRLLESAVYTSEYFDAGALEEAGMLMRDLVLYRKGYRYPGTNPDDFYRSTNIELESRVGSLLKSGTPRDEDQDGAIDDEEVEGYTMSVLVR